jgi:thiamine-phosphate diphosphorylase/hydroxyethylthiazole kinase
LTVVRKLLPPGAIIGVSCGTTEEARKAVEEGADYVGLGSVYSTNTKDVSAPGDMCGVAGVRAMLGVLEGTGIKAVAIGIQIPRFFFLPHSYRKGDPRG